MKIFIVHVTIILFIHNDDIHSHVVHTPDTPWGHYLLHSIPSMAAHMSSNKGEVQSHASHR